MNRTLSTRAGLITTALALIGMLIGVAGAFLLSGRTGGFTARATLAMLPGSNVPITDTPAFWEVLNAGQASRSAAIVLQDSRWLDGAAAAAGVPKSALTLSAGAVPQTTLITVAMRASSATAAKAALDAVLADAVGTAATMSGPFELRPVTASSVQSMSPANTQMFGAMGIAGLVIGAGCGVMLGQSTRLRGEPGAKATAADDVARATNIGPWPARN